MKVKLSRVLTENHAINEDIAPHILDIDTRWR